MPHECPTCGKELATEQGMRQHHTKVHGERLPNCECGDCGEMFYDPKARRTYCDDCYSEAGEKNGNWKGAKETATCRSCGGEFEYYPSDKEGVFCSSCVEESEEFLGTPSWEVWDVERVERACTECAETFDILASTLEREEGRGRFCSHECKSAWMSSNWRGENHHQWVGETVDYAGAWWEVRRLALERDDFTCQRCGDTENDLGRNPDVHHVRPIRTFDDPQDAHYLENVVSLCRSCHRNVEEGNVPVPDVE